MALQVLRTLAGDDATTPRSTAAAVKPSLLRQPEAPPKFFRATGRLRPAYKRAIKYYGVFGYRASDADCP